jgi:hypothetical protein
MRPLNPFTPVRRISADLWTDPRVRALPRPEPNARDLWIFLLTGPHQGRIPSLMRVGEATLVEFLQESEGPVWTLDVFRRLFAQITGEHQVGMDCPKASPKASPKDSGNALAKADWDHRILWIPNALKYNPPATPNVVAGWAVEAERFPDCPLTKEALTHLAAYVQTLSKDFRKALGKAFRKGGVRASSSLSSSLQGLLFSSPEETVGTTTKGARERATRAEGATRGGGKRAKPPATDAPERTPWPPGWQLDDEMRAFAEERGCRNPALAFAAFKAWVDREGGTYVNWSGAWRTRMLNHKRYGCPCQEQPQNGARPHEAPGDRSIRALRNVAEDYRAEGKIR